MHATNKQCSRNSKKMWWYIWASLKALCKNTKAFMLLGNIWMLQCSASVGRKICIFRYVANPLPARIIILSRIGIRVKVFNTLKIGQTSRRQLWSLAHLKLTSGSVSQFLDAAVRLEASIEARLTHPSCHSWCEDYRGAKHPSLSLHSCLTLSARLMILSSRQISDGAFGAARYQITSDNSPPSI